MKKIPKITVKNCYNLKIGTIHNLPIKDGENERIIFIDHLKNKKARSYGDVAKVINNLIKNKVPSEEIDKILNFFAKYILPYSEKTKKYKLGFISFDYGRKIQR